MSGTENFTNEQKQAVYTRGCDLLVAAAAGSGKTAVLVARIIDLITNEEKPVDIDRLLVVTFTEASAGEMRQRISDALYDILDVRDSEFIRRQITLLSKARITTIHSFCLNVVRANFNSIDMDPSFKIADATELNLIQSDLLNEIFEEEYEKKNPAFLDLVEAYGGGKIRDAALKRLVLGFYRLIINTPWPEQTVEDYLRMFPTETSQPLEETVWAEILREKIRTELSGAYFAAERALAMCRQADGPGQYTENLCDDREIIGSLLNMCSRPEVSFETMYEAFIETGFSRLSSKKNPAESEEIRETVKTIREKEIKSVLKKILESVLIKPPALMKADLINVRPAMEALSDLVLIFMDRYSQTKKTRNIADFDDLEHYCLRVLLEPGTDKPTPAARELKEKFVEVYVDEYQDSNPIQELILSTVSRSGGAEGLSNRFMVGDVKQSIYKFRRADPDIFLRKYESFSTDPSAARQKIHLSQNFRSRKIILSAVNFFFYQLMYKDFAGIEYDEKAALYPGAQFGDGAGFNVSQSAEILISLYDKNLESTAADEELLELTKNQQEADMIALRILEIMSPEKRLYVWDNKLNDHRPAEYRDMVILLRSVGGGGDSLSKGAAVEAALKKHDIPAFMNTGGSYFNSLEVSTALGFLRVVDNPRQDIPLLAVLRSPAYMFDLDELLAIKNTPLPDDEQDICFYDRLVRFEETGGKVASEETLDRLGRFFSDLNRWRAAAAVTKVSRLLNTIYTESGYYNYAGALPGGRQRQANLQALLEKAEDYESTSYRGLFHFVAYVERIQKSRSDSALGDAKILSDRDNLVRIMTIHKSKGLEFPIVFVSMLGGKFNTTDEQGPLVTHPSLGLGPAYVDLKTRIRSKTAASIALAHRIHTESLAEELRVLYVAFTRAKEKLILTGTVTNIENARQKWSRNLSLTQKELPISYMSKATSPLDWICAAASRHRDGKPLTEADGFCRELYDYDVRFEISIKNGAEIKEAAQSSCLKPAATSLPEFYRDAGTNADIERLFSWQYPHLADTTLPTKISISEIKRLRQMLEQRDEVTDPGFQFVIPVKQPDFEFPDISELTAARPDSPPKFTAAQKGSIIHSVMEHLDVFKHTGPQEVKELIGRLVEKNILTVHEAETIPLNYILNFLKSETAKKILKAQYVKKETPFVMGLKADEIFKDCGSKQTILVHGIIDLYFGSGNEVTLVDYKTDHVTGSADEIRNEILNRYRLQLRLYKKALERSNGVIVRESIIFLLSLGREIVL